MIYEPQPGDIGLVATSRGSWLDKLASWAIRWGTDSPVNHAFIYRGNGEVIEAVAHVKVTPVSTYSNIIWLGPSFLSNPSIFSEDISGYAQRAVITPTPEDRAEVVAEAEKHIGDHYNIDDILAIAFAQRRLGRTVHGDEPWVKKLSDDHMEICSQLCTIAWRVRYPGFMSTIGDGLAGLVSPGDLLKTRIPNANSTGAS